MDHQKFGQRVIELLHRKGLKQQDLADELYIHKSLLNRILKGSRPLTPHRAKQCILYLVGEGAIDEYEFVYELIDLAGCEDFSSTEWRSSPLKKVSSSEMLRVPPQVAPLQPVSSSDIFDEKAARSKYLARVIRMCDALTLLTTGHQKRLPLQKIFQPLQLCQNTPSSKDLVSEERRAFLDEFIRNDQPAYYEQLHFHRKQPEIVATDGDDALSKSAQQRMIVLGSPGTGKTTLLKHLIIHAALKTQSNLTDMLPIFISLSELQVDHTLRDCLPTIVERLGIDKDYANFLWRAIERGKAFVCIDSLDQASPMQRHHIIEWINLHAAEQGNVWVIGSRFNEYDGGEFDSQFTEWELRPMTHEAQQKLAEVLLPQFYQTVDDTAILPEKGSSVFLDTLEKHPQAVNWSKNPLLFSLAAFVFTQTGTFPSSRASLYREVTSATMAKYPRNLNQETTLRQIIAPFALELHQENKRLFTREMLHRYLKDISRNQESSWNIEEISQKIIDSGLFDVVTRDTYGFWHQTFQEYFAGIELAKNLISQGSASLKKTIAWEKRAYGRWTEVLRLMLGALTQEYRIEGGEQIALSWLHALIEQRQEELQGDVGDLGLVLAMKSLGEIIVVSPYSAQEEWIYIEEQVIHHWLQALLDAAQQGQETRQERLLERSHEVLQLQPSTLALVLRWLTDDNHRQNTQITEIILRVCGKLGKYAPARDYLMTMLDDKNPRLQEVVVQAIIEQNEYAPVDALVDALQSDNSSLRAAAAYIVGELQIQHGLNQIKYLLHDEHQNIRIIAMRALSKFGTQASLDEFYQGLTDEDELIRWATVRSLGELKDSVLIDRLVECLYDESPIVRAATVEALGEIGKFAPLIEMLDDPNDYVRSTAIDILDERAPVEKLLREIITGSSLSELGLAYEFALEVLGKLKDRNLVDELIDTIDTEDHEIQKRVQAERDRHEQSFEVLLYDIFYSNDKFSFLEDISEALEKLETASAIEKFVVSSQTTSELLRATALRIVGKFGIQAPIDQLVKVYDHPDPRVRLSMLKALYDLGNRASEVIDTIITLLQDDVAVIRRTALQVLANVVEYIPIELSLIETVLVASNDEYKPIQSAAKSCLKKLGEYIHNDMLDTLFKHEDLFFRANALEFFGEFASLDQIKRALHDTDAVLRAAAVRALGKQRDAYLWEEIPLYLLDEDDMVYSAAAQTLENLGMHEMLNEFLSRYGITNFDPTEATVTFSLEDIEVYRILADLCHVPELLLIKETINIPLEDLINQGQEKVLFANADYQITFDQENNKDDNLSENISTQIIQEIYDEMHREAVLLLKERAQTSCLVEALRDQNSEVGWIALQALQDQAPEELLILALDNENRKLRREALLILGKRTPLDQLMAALGDYSKSVRDAALEIIKERTEGLPIDGLTGALENRNKLMRASAILALGSHLSKEKLIEMLGDSEEDVRLRAAEMLYHAYSEEIPALLPELTAVFLSEKPSEILASAAKSFIADVIGRMKHPSFFLRRTLAELLFWPYWEVRMKAAQALGNLHRNIPEIAIRRLLMLRNDPTSIAVSLAADNALAEILTLDVGIAEG